MEHLWFDSNDESIRTFSLTNDAATAAMIVGFSARSPEKDASNEDSMGFWGWAPNRLVLAVADGMGGNSCGDRASQSVIRNIAKKLLETADSSQLRESILDAIELANEEILAWGIGAGTTAAIAIVQDGYVRVFHVGDAVVMLCSNRGRVKYTTVAHSPVGMAVEIGMMDESEAIRHEDRNLIFNCIGDREMRIEIGPNLKMGINDTLLVGSDGLFDNLLTQEIVDFIRGPDLEPRVQQMLELARTRMAGSTDEAPAKPDDLSVLCFRQSAASLR